MTSTELQRRIAACPWPAVHEDLHAKGAAILPQLLDASQRAALRESYASGRFRSRIVMEQHNFGRGEYQYFAYPLPAAHTELLARCRRAGQPRPTPLLLRYGAGGYNCLHQDLYGKLSFPLQVVFLLSEPGTDFEGGELLLVEQRPRMQSKARVVPLRAGDGAVFAVNHRPVRGKRGFYKAAMRHGVSEIRSGERFTLGIIFHDAA